MNVKRFLVLAPLLASGCHQADPTFTPSLVPGASFTEAPYDVVWEATKDVLRRYHFRLDETNVRQGLITTWPAGNPHFFEMWRNDWGVGGDAFTDSVLPMRRRAVVEIDRTEGDVGCRVTVTVREERFTTPERRITNSAGIVYFLSQEVATVETGRPAAQEDTFWYAQGRDPALEDMLRNEVLALADTRAH